VFAPTLAAGPIVILDSFGKRKGPRAWRAIRATGDHLIFLPADSPDRYPIK
jgi:hypothetical protein